MSYSDSLAARFPGSVILSALGGEKGLASKVPCPGRISFGELGVLAASSLGDQFTESDHGCNDILNARQTYLAHQTALLVQTRYQTDISFIFNGCHFGDTLIILGPLAPNLL